jgi:hypothetical protein
LAPTITEGSVLVSAINSTSSGVSFLELELQLSIVKTNNKTVFLNTLKHIFNFEL